MTGIRFYKMTGSGNDFVFVDGSEHPVESVKVKDLQATAYAASAIIDAESGEELVKAGAQIGEALSKIQASALKHVDVVNKVADPLILWP